MLDKSKKQELLTKNMNHRKTMNKGQKQKILENKRIKYQEMDQSKKEELLTKNMNYKETMSKEQKQTIREHESQISSNGYIKEKEDECYGFK